MTNPLLDKTRFVPDFDAVKPEHFEPASDACIETIREKVALLKTTDDAPTFENTVKPLETLFFDLGRIHRIFGAFYSNNTNKQIDDLSKPLSLKSSAISKEIYQDQELAARFGAVYEMRDQLGLSEQQQRVLENIYRAFENNGTFLNDNDKKELNRIDNELIAHCDTFRKHNVAAASQQAFLITNISELAGVADDVRSSFQENVAKVVAGLKPGAKTSDKEFVEKLPPAVVAEIAKREANGTLGEAYLFKPERLLVDQLLESAESGSFRKNMFQALNRIGTQEPYNVEEPIREIQELRQERIAVLNKGREAGKEYKNYADFALSFTMAGSLKNVDGLFAELQEPLLAQFEQDVKTLEAFAASKGSTDPVEPWDVPYWASRYKNETWQFDSAKMSEYLEVNNVVNGFLAHSSKLFGLQFTESTNHSKIHPDVRTFDVTDAKTGAPVGVLHMDLFARPGKRDGAWATALQNRHDDKPVVAIMNCNLAKPAEGKAALMSPDQVETLFHEGGHALNQILGTVSQYVTLHGTAHPMDFVENHSMVQERWAMARQVLATYAKHYLTGAPLPEELIAAREASSSFMQSRGPLLLIQNSKRDFLFHSTAPENYKGIAATHEKAKLDSDYAGHIRPYPLSRFSHLFDSPSSAYASGYYSYLWADSCAADIYNFFETTDLYNPERAEALKQFYADGASRKPAQSFRNFAGRDPSTKAFLAQLGIAAEGNNEPAKKPGPDLQP